MLETNSAELSERETEILRLVATGASNKEIAQELAISPNTVKVHLRNIFANIGVASRTEATLYAIQHGFAPVPGAGSSPLSLPAAAPSRSRWRRLGVVGAALLVLVILLLTARFLPGWLATAPTATATAPTIEWKELAALSPARTGLGMAVYDNQLYVMGGEVDSEPIAATERYDPQTDTWAMLRPMTEPRSDVSAVVIGGLIYVPGGRMPDGSISDHLSVYDPRQDVWEARARLPEPRSAYAAVAFEGRMLLFGGWDGQGYTATVFEYDPDRDRWQSRTPMPGARGLAGVAVAGGKVYLVGGENEGPGRQPSLAYLPDRDRPGDTPWLELEPLPIGPTAASAASIADLIYVYGREPGSGLWTLWQYLPAQDAWQRLNFPASAAADVKLASIATSLHILNNTSGGPAGHLLYSAVHAAFLPVISSGDDQGQDR